MSTTLIFLINNLKKITYCTFKKRKINKEHVLEHHRLFMVVFNVLFCVIIVHFIYVNLFGKDLGQDLETIKVWHCHE